MIRNKICSIALLAILLSWPLFAQSTSTRPRILGISHVGFFVSDLPKALDFWHGLLGYDESAEHKNPDGTIHNVILKINNHQTLNSSTCSPPQAPVPQQHRLHGLERRTDAPLPHLPRRPRGSPVGKNTTGDLTLTIKDPDGNLVEFDEPQPDGLEAKTAGKFVPATRISDSIYHLGFLVGNSQKSIEFYGDLLGFHEFWRGSSNGTRLSWIDMQVPDGKDYVEFMLYSDFRLPTNAAARSTSRSSSQMWQNPSVSSSLAPPTRPTENQ